MYLFISFFLIMWRPLFPLVFLPVHGDVESWGRWLWICELRLRHLRTPVVLPCPLPTGLLRPCLRHLEKVMGLGGHKRTKKSVLCRTLKPPVTGMNLLLDIFSQDRDFRCLMHDRGWRDILRCPE